MQRIDLKLGKRGYPILIGPGLFGERREPAQVGHQHAHLPLGSAEAGLAGIGEERGGYVR